MTERIITNDEITKLLGLSTAQAALVDMLNDIAHETLFDILGVDQLGSRSVSEEYTEIVNPELIRFNQAPVDFSQTITLKDMTRSTIQNINFEQHKRGLRTARILDQNSLPSMVGYKEVYASYTAGYSLYDTVLFSDAQSEDETIVVKYAGVETTYTFKTSPSGDTEVLIGASATETAANFAAKFTGATADTGTVTMPLGYEVQSGSGDVTITSNTIPKQLKMAISLIVGGGYAEKDKKGGISSYTIGPKTVSFRTDQDRNMFASIMSTWAPKFQKVKIRGV